MQGIKDQYFSNKFHSTFGFSHGVGGMYDQGTNPMLAGGNKKKRFGGKGIKEQRLEDSFSFASGGSVNTKRMDESFTVIPESHLDIHAVRAAASKLAMTTMTMT